MTRYAETTIVPVERSRAELEKLIRGRGAKQVAQFTDDTGFSAIQFFMNNRLLRFTVQVPPIADFARDKNGYAMGEERQQKAWEQEERRRWRVLILTIKARLEEVDNDLASFDEAFLPYIVLPDNQTVADVLLPALTEAYETGKVPDLRRSFLALPPPQQNGPPR